MRKCKIIYRKKNNINILLVKKTLYETKYQYFCYFLMKIQIETQVNQSIHQVWKGFDEKLFMALAPPFPKVKLLRFDGCKAGDEVQIELNFFGLKQHWFAKIMSQTQSETEYQFVDVGTEMPIFVKKWTHTHSIIQEASGAIIIDNIEFQTWNIITDLLFYPTFYLQFLYRKPIYKRFFR